ncbi:MAG TPA: outer membrane lipoprotein carrier protein LolA [Candidatus Acidoferrales bacterium]|nr:outer membrane lipoprotein carrier protein LolA [Candidatus Acidoferrales bacterium]
MSRRPLLFALLLFAALPAAADEPDVKAVVRALEQHYNNVRTLEADFVQRYTLGANTVVESGHVYFLKPGRMRWDYTSPDGKFFLTDGEYAYLYSRAEAQVRRQSMKKTPQWQAAFALLLGRVDLSRIFDPIQLVRVHQLGTPARWQLRAQAKSDQQGFHEVWLDLNDRYQLLRIEIRQSDGSLMEFHFRQWREQHPLSPELFRLQVSPGTVWLDEESF